MAECKVWKSGEKAAGTPEIDHPLLRAASRSEGPFCVQDPPGSRHKYLLRSHFSPGVVLHQRSRLEFREKIGPPLLDSAGGPDSVFTLGSPCPAGLQVGLKHQKEV